MRVYDQNLNGAAAAQTGGTHETQRAGRSGEIRSQGVAGDGDRVEISNSLATLSRALDTFHGDRAARVQELAAQYRSGAYQADSAATSRAMISDALGAAVG
jgi:hypothetical protein